MAIVERDKTGKWVKGSSGNPIGGHRQANTLQALKVIKQKDVKALVIKWLDMALNGDVRAGKLLADILFAKPTTQVELTADKETIFDKLGINAKSD